MSVLFNKELEDIRSQSINLIVKLEDIVKLVDKYESTENIDNMIFELRSKGVSFAQIGQVVNLSATAVRNRFNKLLVKGDEIEL